jgi:hypothetical protein
LEAPADHSHRKSAIVGSALLATMAFVGMRFLVRLDAAAAGEQFFNLAEVGGVAGEDRGGEQRGPEPVADAWPGAFRRRREQGEGEEEEESDEAMEGHEGGRARDVAMRADNSNSASDYEDREVGVGRFAPSVRLETFDALDGERERTTAATTLHRRGRGPLTGRSARQQPNSADQGTHERDKAPLHGHNDDDDDDDLPLLPRRVAPRAAAAAAAAAASSSRSSITRTAGDACADDVPLLDMSGPPAQGLQQHHRRTRGGAAGAHEEQEDDGVNSDESRSLL